MTWWGAWEARWRKELEEWERWESEGWVWVWHRLHLRGGGRGRWTHPEEERLQERLDWAYWSRREYLRHRDFQAYRSPSGFWIGWDGREYWSEECLTPRD